MFGNKAGLTNAHTYSIQNRFQPSMSAIVRTCSGGKRHLIAFEGFKAFLAMLKGFLLQDFLRMKNVRALDDSHPDAYRATLTDDAKFVSVEGSYAGKEAIRRYVEGLFWGCRIKSAASVVMLTALKPMIQYSAVAFWRRKKHA